MPVKALQTGGPSPKLVDVLRLPNRVHCPSLSRLRIQRCMFREKPYLLFQTTNKSPKYSHLFYPINLKSQCSGQARSYKHVKPQQDSQHLKTITHYDKCPPPSAVIISGVPRGTCSVPSLSFRATLFCSKLPMPSRPHRDIIFLSCETKVERRVPYT